MTEQAAAPTGEVRRAPVPAPPPPVPAAPGVPVLPGPSARPRRRRRGARRALTVTLCVLVLVLGGLVLHLYRTTTAWQDRAEEYRGAAEDLGEQVATGRAELEGARSELDAVRAQLATAQQRIVELADEKAQLGDDREVQRQLVDYQQRVSDAAGDVALALDQCVQGQDQLIAYLQRPELYDPAQLEEYGTGVSALCQAATDANAALQRELER